LAGITPGLRTKPLSAHRVKARTKGHALARRKLNAFMGLALLVNNLIMNKQ